MQGADSHQRIARRYILQQHFRVTTVIQQHLAVFKEQADGARYAGQSVLLCHDSCRLNAGGAQALQPFVESLAIDHGDGYPAAVVARASGKVKIVYVIRENLFHRIRQRRLQPTAFDRDIDRRCQYVRTWHQHQHASITGVSPRLGEGSGHRRSQPAAVRVHCYPVSSLLRIGFEPDYQILSHGGLLWDS